MRCSMLSGHLILLKMYLFLINNRNFGDAVVYQVFNGFQNGPKFECGKAVTLRCNLQTILSTISWYAEKDGIPPNAIAARCTTPTTICLKNQFLPASYNFTFDINGTYSDLTIAPVNSSEHNANFTCDDGSSKKFEALLVVPPSSSSTINGTVPLQNGKEFSVTTDCIYPASLIKFVWYSSKADGSGRKDHLNTTEVFSKCQTAHACVIANESKQVSSALKLYIPGLLTVNTGNEILIRVEVIFDDKLLFTLTVGSYREPDTTTISTTTSAPSLPTTSTENIKTSNPTETSIIKTSFTTSQIPGNEKNKKADQTSTILIAAFSSMAGIILLLIAVFAFNKMRKRHKQQSAASTMYEMKTGKNNKY